MARKTLVAIIIIAVLISSISLVFKFFKGKRVSGLIPEQLKNYEEKRWEGYDVFLAEYFLKQAKYFKGKEESQKAKKIYEKAFSVLREAKVLPSVEKRKWNITDSNIHIEKTPTEWDFLPIGTVFVESENGYLTYPSNDLGWKLSCFIFVGYGETKDREHVFAYQGRLPFTGEKRHVPVIYLDGKWIKPFPAFLSPLYIDKTHKYSPYNYLTVYNYDISSSYVQILGYNEKERTWIHKIEPVNGTGAKLEILARAKGVPFWIGEWDKDFIIHGVTFNKKDLDIWGGFWDSGEMKVNLTIQGEKYEFEGWFLFDRASHRTYYFESKREGGAGAPLAFSCTIIYQENLNIMLCSTENPSPLKTHVNFQHQARINLFDKNESYVLTSFNFTDNKANNGLQPTEFYLNGAYGKGKISVRGEVISFWPAKWGINKGTWWNPNGLRDWGRALVHWQGKITYENETIKVDAVGIGEFTRYASLTQSISN